MPTDIEDQFDLMCRLHSERPMDERFRRDRLCTECGIKAWNAGAKIADETWADTSRRITDEEAKP